MAEKITSFIDYIIKNLVTDGDQVTVSNEEKGGLNLIQVKVSQKDMGRVIGHAGSRIKAIRLIASAVGATENQKVKVTLVE